jgi:branched-chain amino acid transport system permease protein
LIELFFQYLVAGLTYGTIYAIVGIGFNIIYNTTGIINFAQGEFVMLGGMTAVTFYAFLPLPLAIVGAVLCTMIIGGLIEMTFIRWLVKPSVLRMIIITIGISILIREAALMLWGEGVRSLPYFTGNEISSVAGVVEHRRLYRYCGSAESFFQVHYAWQRDAGMRRQP